MGIALKGITPKIDSCGGLIAKKAHGAYRRVSAAHRRWIDPEDLIQEGLLRAHLVEKEHRKRGGAKYSSYLFVGLGWHLAKIVDSLKFESRQAVVEHNGRKWDLPVEELDRVMPSGMPVGNLIPAQSVPYAYTGGTSGVTLTPEYVDTVKAFMELCRAVSSRAVAVLVRGFIFSDNKFATPEICAEIGAAAARLRIGVNDLRLVGQDEILQKILLTLIGRHVMIEEGTEEALLRILRCQVCGGDFSIAAIRDDPEFNGPRFFVGPMTCRACFRKLQKQPSEISCFGKPKRAGKEGYSPVDIECRVHCADKAVCARFVKEKIMTDAAEKAVDDMEFDDVETSTKKPTTKKVVKAAKDKKAKKGPAKADSAERVTAAKERAAEEKAAGWPIPFAEVPKEVVQWPYKRGSGMLYVFMHMLVGCNKKALERDVVVNSTATKESEQVHTQAGIKEAYAGLSDKRKKKGEASWRNFLKIMKRYEHREHNWKLDEEGDQYKIHGVKFTGKAKKDKAA